MTNHFEKYLKFTIEGINKLIEDKSHFVDTKTIRKINDIKSSERSKTNFIWRSLKILYSQSYLENNGYSNPRRYKIIPKVKIDINKIVNKIIKKN